MTDLVESERTEFETWVLSNPKLFGMGALTRSRLEPESYANSFVKGAWWAWKALEARLATIEAATNRYLNSVAKLGEQSGYNKLTFFEAPISKMPNDELGMEAVNRWRELNDSGVALRSAIAPLDREAVVNIPRLNTTDAELQRIGNQCNDGSDNPIMLDRRFVIMLVEYCRDARAALAAMGVGR